MQAAGYSIIALFLCILPMAGAGSPEERFYLTCNFGMFLAVPLLALYNGKLGSGRNLKWLFYIFYPLHMLILGFLFYWGL